MIGFMKQKSIVAVVLAAGEAKRMGSAKQLLPWGSGTVLGATLAQVLASKIDGVLVVTGAYRDEVIKIAEQHQVQAVHNPDFATGEMLSSVQIGVQNLPAKTNAMMVVLADQPMVETWVYDAVLENYRAGEQGLVGVENAGIRGNPVLFDKKYFPAILNLPSNSAPRAILQKHAHDLQLVSVNTNSILHDLDTPESYQHWLASSHS
jgi:molybdenum cofactor cytidylyltransferase